MSQARRLGDWLDARTGYRELLGRALDEPVLGGARWAYVFGSVLTMIFVIQAVTGLLLMTTYAPSASTAWASVHYISYHLTAGWIIRGLHHFGSQAMVILVVLHLAQVALFGAYKKPREINWWFGLGLLAVTLGFSLTGYLLPWDQKGYWATRVATNIAGTTPVLGGWLQAFMQGGTEYGSLTLTRFYSAHVGLFPASLVLLLVAHVALFRKHGVTPAAGADLTKVDAFFPKQLLLDLLAGLAVTGVLFVMVLREHGAPLDAPADPASDYPARPEWYFLSLFQLLKYFEGPLEIVGTMLIPGLAGAFLFLLPLLDRAPSTAVRPRLVYLAPLLFGLMAIVGLTFLSFSADAHDAAFQAARRKADSRAEVATRLANVGVPPGGPLEMLRDDPELHGEELFGKHCAGCHVLGDQGDKEKASASTLDGWGTPPWILAMIHDPDDKARFGATPYKGQMPSVDVAPKDRKPTDAPFKPMPHEEMQAIAAFLASQEASAPPYGDAAERSRGEKIVADRCTACHLYKGDGDLGSSEVAPELAGYASVAWVTAQIKNPATPATYRSHAIDEGGPKGHMPRFDGDMSPAEVELLARFTVARARAIPMGQVVAAPPTTSATPPPPPPSGAPSAAPPPPPPPR
jgi:ubiquinol-cytochrome c reductase cytochrome b subunit